MTAAGLALPGPGRAIGDAHGITVVLVVLVAAIGLGLPASALGEARERTGRIGLLVVVPLLALPALAYAASRLVDPGPLRNGVLAAGVSPAEVAAVALAAFAGGSAALAAAVLVGSTVGSVLLAGPTLHLLAPDAGGLSNVALLVSLLAIVALPLAIGLLTRARLPASRRATADQLSSAVASVAVLALIWLVASQADLGVQYLRAGLALLVFLAASVVLALALTRGLPRTVRVSLLLPVALRDFAVAAGIATRAFGAPAAAALGLYGVLVLALGAVVSRASSRRR